MPNVEARKFSMALTVTTYFRAIANHCTTQLIKEPAPRIPLTPKHKQKRSLREPDKGYGFGRSFDSAIAAPYTPSWSPQLETTSRKASRACRISPLCKVNSPMKNLTSQSRSACSTVRPLCAAAKTSSTLCVPAYKFNTADGHTSGLTFFTLPKISSRSSSPLWARAMCNQIAVYGFVGRMRTAIKKSAMAKSISPENN